MSKIVVHLTSSGDPVVIMMLQTDTLQFVADVAGTFTSNDLRYFCPPLPHSKALSAGEIWPHVKDYPEGTEPNPYAAGKICIFGWAADAQVQENLLAAPGTIHVDSGTEG